MPDSSRSYGKVQRDYVQGNMPWSFGCCRKLQRRIEIQLQTTMLDHHDLQVSTSMKSAIHLDSDHNLIACQNTNFEGIKTLFDISLRLIAENSCEILNLSTMMYDFFLSMDENDPVP